MGIMAILLATVIPAITGINESNNIAQGGQLFADQVALARQTASAQNQTVEVRCIVVPTRSTVGYSTIQLWSPSTSSPVARPQNLPDGVAISQATNTISTLFTNFPPGGVMASGVNLAGDTYASFTVSPSGLLGPLGTVSPNMVNAVVAIMPTRYATSTTLPKNYMVVQVNPLTAATVNYRP